MAKPQRSPRSQLRVQSRVNDNHCVNSVTGQVGLNPTPVVAGNSKVTLDLNVNFCVANAHIVIGCHKGKA